jgi:hypothetical protein
VHLETCFSALAVALRFRPRFDEVEHIMTRILNRPGHIRAANGSVVRLDVEMGRYAGTCYGPDLSVRAVVYGSLAEVQTAMRGWTFVAETI